MAQTQLLPFPSAIRGDVACRFESPKASIILLSDGHASYGLTDRPTRKIISHAFEQQKNQENTASSLRQADRPQGRRFWAATEFQEKTVQQRSQKALEEEQKQVQHVRDSLAGVYHCLPEYQTSLANPLRPQSLAPAASRCASPIDGCLPSRCCTPDFDRARFQKAHNLDDHLELGSLAPTQDEHDGLSEAQASLLAMRVQEEADKVHEMEEVADATVRSYPHGVPKRLQLDMKQKGVNLPSLGFGITPHMPCSQSVRRYY